MDKITNCYIVSKKYINEEDLEQINKLKEICLLEEKINLKLELDYRISILKNYEQKINDNNEFLYYINDQLVGYVSISCFDNATLEITGMVHPKFRRRGIFTKLCTLALEEAKRRGNNDILLLFDSNSKVAKLAIEKFKCNYSFSEYLMIRNDNLLNDNLNKDIELFKLENDNLEEVRVLAEEIFEEVIDRIDLSPNSSFYLIKKENEAIGKIKLEFDKESSSGYISWFGIRKEFRGLGYGKSALNKALETFNKEKVYKVTLDVNASNENALNLYKDCGFKEELVMDYFEVN